MPLFEVHNSQQIRQFLDVPTRLYQQYPEWISPLDHEIEAVFSPQKNRLLREGKGEVVRWILTNDAGTAIGRVAAFINTALPQEIPNLPVGGMGFFECIDDQQAAVTLFDACRTWLEARGMAAMDGPINFGERDRFWGLLVDGFTEPNYGMFYHPPYYQQLFEQYGFQVYFKQYTYDIPTDIKLHPNFAKVADRYAREEPEYRFAYANASDPEKLARDFHHVYSLAWARHSGVSDMSLEQARNIVREMKPVLDERLLWFIYYRDEAVGFFISLPELNQIFKHVGRKLDTLGKLRFLWEKYQYQRRQPKKAFGVIFGVVPEHQGKGAESAMIYRAQSVYQKAGYTSLEMNWIGDFNPRMMAVCRSIGARIVKTHVTYRLLFDETRPFERCPIIR
ncbi:hypothetical protein H8B15_15675 [Hymenobacter sp. BT507]|uniref:GNAT family N-acetyltransferase n=1 Tax=Hymenobacter citatus TaxID=2763506 RepID=A0ABR7MMQ6_9BACT|nr:hypothetical protein [Hymenobacter citatus]MBC6612365.1 hypothetical protein [Hymenobacter citatus]